MQTGRDFFMRKIICVLLIFALLFCGCTNTADTGKDVPELVKEAKVSRWYPERTETLIPRDDYGELVIFCAGYRYDNTNGYDMQQLFGLMTLDGKIVVDAVFNDYHTYELDGKKYYSMMISEHELYEGGEYTCTSMLVSSDGSWCVTVDSFIDHITPERIFTSKYGQYFKCYDHNGNLIFEGGDELDYAWNNGTSSHTKLFGAYNWEEYDTPLLVFDMDGNVVFDEFTFFTGFESGKSVVRMLDTQKYGIISDSGEWLLEPDFSEIKTVEDEYFVAVLDNTVVDVYDKELNLVHAFTTEDYDAQTRYYEIADGRLLYYCGHIDAKDDYYRDMFTDEIITCKENGLPATDYDQERNLFTAIDENEDKWYFDVNGNVEGVKNVVDALPYQGDIWEVYDNNEGTITKKYYIKQTGEEIYSITGTDEKTESISFAEYNGYTDLAIISDVRKIEFPLYKSTDDLCNYKTGEVFLENCENITVSEYGGKQFLTAIYKDYIYIYDEDFNLIMGTENLLYT